MCFIYLCKYLFDRKLPSTPENGSPNDPLWFSDGVLATWNRLKGQKTLLLQCLNCSIKVTVWQMCAKFFKGLLQILKPLFLQIRFMIFSNQSFSNYRCKVVSPFTLVSIGNWRQWGSPSLSYCRAEIQSISSAFQILALSCSSFDKDSFISITIQVVTLQEVQAAITYLGLSTSEWLMGRQWV